MNFVKMHAHGNDYIYLNEDDVKQLNARHLAKRLSCRQLGIGGDGIITVKRLSEKELEMRIFNADGSEGKTCGNGLRCAHLFAKNHLGETDDTVTVFTSGGATLSRLIKKGQSFKGDKIISSLSECEFLLPTVNKSCDKLTNALQKVGLYVDKRDIFEVNTGNNHLVLFTDAYSVEAISAAVRKTNLFPDGVNIERVYSVEKTDQSNYSLEVDFYERGSGKTLSCGSGTVALASALSHRLGKPFCPLLTIAVRGTVGSQTVRFSESAAILKGEINEVFKGEFYEV